MSVTKKRKASFYIPAFILFAAAIGYLCYMGFSENGVYFLNVAEAKAQSLDKLRQARLFGTVAVDGFNQDINTISFHLADKDNADQTIPVLYTGLVPDTFKSGAEVIVEGGMASDGRFLAKTLMTKCPSKYRKENRGI